MFLYAVSGIVADQPDNVERTIQQIADYLRPAVAFVGKMAGEHPNEFVIALSALATAIFTYFLATRTRGLFKETAGLREETAVLAKFAKQQADDMKASIGAAEKSADVAQRALIAGDRAWVRPILEFGSPLVFHEQGASVSINVEMINVGKSPAINVNLHVWLGAIPAEGGTVPWVTHEIRCDEVRSKPAAHGYTLFPGDRFPQNMKLGGFSHSVNIGQEEITRGCAAPGNLLGLVLYGCVDYTFATDPEGHHQTRFIYNVYRNPPNMFIGPSEKRIEAAELMLTDFGLGIGTRAD